MRGILTVEQRFSLRMTKLNEKFTFLIVILKERLSATVSIPYCESRNYPFIIDFGLFYFLTRLIAEKSGAPYSAS